MGALIGGLSAWFAFRAVDYRALWIVTSSADPFMVTLAAGSVVLTIAALNVATDIVVISSLQIDSRRLIELESLCFERGVTLTVS